MTAETSPIACTLTPGDFKDRTRWIRQLAERHVRAARREPLALHLTDTCVAAEHVRELVRHEQSCCSFLRFELGEDQDGARLTITAAEQAGEAV